MLGQYKKDRLCFTAEPVNVLLNKNLSMKTYN
jgi:hypothetical protein